MTARRARTPRWTALAMVASAIVAAIAPGCAFIQPEVGDRLEACVDADSSAARFDFARDIRPLLAGERPPTKGCKNCHYEGQGTQQGVNEVRFKMNTLGDLKKGGINSGAGVVVPGSPCKSVIVQKLRGTFGGARMPKEGPFWGDAEIRLMMDWIAEGALGGDEL